MTLRLRREGIVACLSGKLVVAETSLTDNQLVNRIHSLNKPYREEELAFMGEHSRRQEELEALRKLAHNTHVTPTQKGNLRGKFRRARNKLKAYEEETHSALNQIHRFAYPHFAQGENFVAFSTGVYDKSAIVSNKQRLAVLISYPQIPGTTELDTTSFHDELAGYVLARGRVQLIFDSSRQDLPTSSKLEVPVANGRYLCRYTRKGNMFELTRLD